MLKQTIRNSIIGGIVFSLTVMIFGLSYAAWSLLPTETDGQPFTRAKWNAVIDRLNSIDQKQLATAWVNFDGTSCTGGAGNECVIRDSYNVSKIVRVTTGQYSVYFTIPMDNSNYTVSGVGGSGYEIFSNVTSNTKSMANVNSWFNGYANVNIAATFFGGKN